MRRLRQLLIVCSCVLGAVIAVNLFAATKFQGHGLVFMSGIKLAPSGSTRLSLPPLGTVSAGTHRAPVMILLELRGLQPSILKEISASAAANEEKLLAGITEEAKQAMTRTGLLAIVLAGAGSLAALILWRRRRPWQLAGALGGGMLGCALILAWTYSGFDAAALKQPRYEGMLESAPWVMSIIPDSFNGLEKLGEGFAAMAKNLPRLSERGADGAPMAELDEDLRVLHVSDIHDNPAGIELLASLARSFSVDLVVDTGDLTEFGTPLKGDLIAGIRTLGVPYVFVPGNHDSPAEINQLKQAPNVLIADGRVLNVKGLHLLGLADPASRVLDTDVPQAEQLRRAAAELSEKWRAASAKPELVLAHNPVLLEGLLGQAPVVLHGHDHRMRLRRSRGTVIEDAGTSGAVGLRGLGYPQAPAYTLVMQYWRKDAEGRFTLIAVDLISVDGLNGKLQVERSLIEKTPARQPV